MLLGSRNDCNSYSVCNHSEPLQAQYMVLIFAHIMVLCTLLLS